MQLIPLVSNYLETERRLLKYCRVNSDRLVNLVDVYKHGKTYFLVLEFTDAYSTVSNLMKSYRKRQRGEYSEEFCKFTIYSVLRGIQALQLEPGLLEHANLSVKSVLVNLKTAQIKIISEPGVDAKKVRDKIKDIWSQLQLFAFELAEGEEISSSDLYNIHSIVIRNISQDGVLVPILKHRSQDYQNFIDYFENRENIEVSDLLALPFLRGADQHEEEFKVVVGRFQQMHRGLSAFD